MSVPALAFSCTSSTADLLLPFPNRPKSAKHKKERKADFTKAKLKLGKGKQVAANATSTAFASKAIALPSQSLASGPKGEPVSRRNLTVAELLVHTRHYSTPVKREALVDLHQLLDAHPHLLTVHLLPLITALAHLVADPSRSVRAAVRTLVADSVLSSRLSHATRVAVAPALVLFTLAALSSLDDPVRTDALALLDLLLVHLPRELTRGFDPTRSASLSGVEGSEGPAGSDRDAPTGLKVVAALLGLLRVRSAAVAAASGSFTAASAAPDLAPDTRLAVLKTLARFLDAADPRRRHQLPPSEGSGSRPGLEGEEGDEDANGDQGASGGLLSTRDEPWFLAGAFTGPEAYADWLARVPHAAPSPTRRRRMIVPVLQSSSSTVGATTSMPVEPFACAWESGLAAADGPFALGPLAAFGLVTPPASPALRPSPASTSNEGGSSSSTLPPAAAALPPPLLHLVYPTLLSGFLDSAPSAFAPSLGSGGGSPDAGATSASLHVETVSAVLRVARALFAHELAGTGAQGHLEAAAVGSAGPKSSVRHPATPLSTQDARARLVTLLGHAAPYFPFGAVDGASALGSSSRAAAAAQAEQSQELNLAFAELTSLLVLSSPSGNKGKKVARGKKDAGRERVEDVVLVRVQEWVVQALRGELTSPSHPLGLPLPAHAFTSLRPTLWALLNQTSAPDASAEVFTAIVDYFARAGVSGGRAGAGSTAGEAKRVSGEFVAWLVLIHSSPSYLAPFSLSALASQLEAAPGLSPREQAANPLAKWLAQLPRWLWELGAQREDETEMILTVLLKLVQQAPKGLFPSATLVALAPLLGPFFHLAHPTRGPMPGAFTQLSPTVQARALDLVALLCRLDRTGDSPPTTQGLREALARAVRVTGVEEAVGARCRMLGLLQ